MARGLIYAFVARRPSTVLCDHTAFAGNFSVVALQVRCGQERQSSPPKKKDVAWRVGIFARRARQANLVAALEAESALWLVDDDAIDAKITEELFAEPGSTGLVTAESHFYWRYAAVVDADVGKGTPPPEDLALLKADAAKAEAARVATTTERLMRTQAAHLTEYHAILDDAADIADAIQDLEVQVMKPRPFVKRGPK